MTTRGRGGPDCGWLLGGHACAHHACSWAPAQPHLRGQLSLGSLETHRELTMDGGGLAPEQLGNATEL